MLRRSKGKEVNGWVVVDKKEGYTSTSLVNKLRWVLKARKAGHVGTLDPDATGVLGIALGEATKTIPYINDTPKTYNFKIHFGAATDTDDSSGRTIKLSDARPSDSQLNSILRAFRGNIKQIPPRYSSVKLNGKRAYDLSRKGIKDFKLEPRNLLIEELEIVERNDINSVRMKMVCGRGGYVRSIARDIGEHLGCFAHASQIRRLRSGPFTLEDAISSEIIFRGKIEKIYEKMFPIHSPLKNLGRFSCEQVEVEKIINGRKIGMKENRIKDESPILVFCNNEPVAIGKILNNYFYPKKVFAYAADRQSS